LAFGADIGQPLPLAVKDAHPPAPVFGKIEPPVEAPDHIIGAVKTVNRPPLALLNKTVYIDPYNFVTPIGHNPDRAVFQGQDRSGLTVINDGFMAAGITAGINITDIVIRHREKAAAVPDRFNTTCQKQGILGKGLISLKGGLPLPQGNIFKPRTIVGTAQPIQDKGLPGAERKGPFKGKDGLI
jgi:hypothetical protein